LTWIEDRNEVLYNLDTDTSIPPIQAQAVFFIFTNPTSTDYGKTLRRWQFFASS